MKSAKIFKYLILLILSIILLPALPIFFLIDLSVNLTRKDLCKFLKERYGWLSWIKTYKSFLKSFNNKKDNKLILCLATSAGEIATLEALFEKYSKANFFILTTSITGRNRCCNFASNSKIQYMPIPNFLFTMTIFSLLKPDLFLVVESEFWISYFITSKILNIPIVAVQIRHTMFQKKITELYYYTFIRLCAWIILPEERDAYPDNFPFEKVKFFNTDLKLLKVRVKKANCRKVFCIFASTHKEEEVVFFECINKMIDSFEGIFVIAPRHPQRAKEISDFALKKDLCPIFLSEILDFLTKEVDNIDDTKNNIDNQEFILSLKKKMPLHFKNTDIMKKINNEKLSQFQNANFKNLQNPINRRFIIIVDLFGKLDWLYDHSKVTIMGGTFYDYKGGHNIYEPLLSASFCIAGKYLLNLLSFFKEAEKAGLTSLVSDFNKLDFEILKFWEISKSLENKNGILQFEGSQFEKLYIETQNVKQQILHEFSQF